MNEYIITIGVSFLLYFVYSSFICLIVLRLMDDEEAKANLDKSPKLQIGYLLGSIIGFIGTYVASLYFYDLSVGFAIFLGFALFILTVMILSSPSIARFGFLTTVLYSTIMVLSLQIVSL